jgi:sugar-specific transcriptional regulator TrmB
VSKEKIFIVSFTVKIMKYRELLTEIGLTNWESQTYLALLEIGSTTTGPLVQKSEVPQSKIYGVLDSLIKNGLVNYVIKGKIKYFQASDSKRILDLFKEKEKKIEFLLNELKNKQSEEKHSVELFEGLKSIRMMLVSMIKNVKKEEWYGFSTGKTSTNLKIEEFYEWWGAQKLLAGLKDHLLISLENRDIFLKSSSKEALQFIKKITKYTPISFPGDVAIFRNQVVILNWEETPTAILITSQNLSKQYKDFFLGLWKVAEQ